MTPRRAQRLAAVLAIVTFLGACSGATTSPAPTSTDASSSPATTAASAAGTSEPGASTGSAQQVSASSASYDELVAALAAAGVPNAARWANEVMEYRPYPAEDPTLQRLQDNLAKYNPDPATLAAILSALAP
jgi:uncharacterized protein with LGFP repeats